VPRKYLLSLLLAIAVCAPQLARAGRALVPEDWYRFQALSDLQISADGAAVAYLVTSFERQADESRSALWLSDWTGGGARQLTHGESVTAPRFSPDGRYLSFLTARPAGAATQLWLMDRRSGEAHAVSHVGAVITAYEWSPDGGHVVLVMHARTQAAQPLVIDAFQFKSDGDGYFTAASRTHLYLLDVRSGKCEALADEVQRQDSLPVFSPDGGEIAFVGNGLEQKDMGRDDVYIVAARPAAAPRRLLSTWSPNYQNLQWSPDGTSLTYLAGSEPKFSLFIDDALMLADVRTGKARALAGALDRGVFNPRFAADGRAILFTVEDDGYQYPAQVSLATGAVTRLGDAMVVAALATAAGHTAVLVSSDRAPTEVYSLEQGKLRRLSAHNDALFAELALGSVEDLRFASGDGVPIHGQIVKPPGFVAGHRYPTIAWLHGGPVGQDDHSLELWGYAPPLERQFFATHGYVVLAINYRGSTGRGEGFARALAADWGHRDVEDLSAGIDYVVRQGLADPARLGIGGWSYGGILTDYFIASDARMKAAISGAGSANATAMYGTDEYTVEYNAELTPPWRDTGLWLRKSYAFFHADRIRTPTLFMGGDRDFNVPIAGGEQMYQALRTLGVPTQLVVYPDENHVFTRPSFLVDRERRFLGWMDQYLKP
jgi:dipeptidyl aminopeptidase/acylaminoacyl peptidase